MKAVFGLLCACTLGAQTATVTGTVTNAITHEPIGNVMLELRASGGMISWGGFVSDAAGAFRILGVRPGTYFLHTSKTGFHAEDTEIQLEAAAETAPLYLTMMPWPGLRGRVLDGERHGVPRVEVQAWRRGDNAPRSTMTDADGRYAFDRLSPGEYTLMASPPAGAAPSLAPTFFPNGTRKEEAMRMTLTAGADLADYDIVLRSVPVFRVSGKVMDERGEPVPGATIHMTTAAMKTNARADGTFELPAVRSGDGRLSAELQRDGVALRGFAPVLVTSHDVENVTVRLVAPLAIDLTVEVAGGRAQKCDAVLRPVDGRGERASATVSESGVRFDLVYPGRYRLAIDPQWSRSQGLYVDSFRLGERDVTMDDFDVIAGMPPLRVILRSAGGHVRGTVENGDGGLLVLVPQEERLRVRPFVIVSFFQGGQLDIDHVRPGAYYAFAVKSSFNADEMQNPAYGGPLLEAASSVRIELNSTATLALGYVKVPESQ